MLCSHYHTTTYASLTTLHSCQHWLFYGFLWISASLEAYSSVSKFLVFVVGLFRAESFSHLSCSFCVPPQATLFTPKMFSLLFNNWDSVIYSVTNSQSFSFAAVKNTPTHLNEIWSNGLQTNHWSCLDNMTSSKIQICPSKFFIGIGC